MRGIAEEARLWIEKLEHPNLVDFGYNIFLKSGHGEPSENKANSIGDVATTSRRCQRPMDRMQLANRVRLVAIELDGNTVASGQPDGRSDIRRGAVAWDEATTFLTEIEKDSQLAGRAAERAIVLLAEGKSNESIAQADQAVALESKYRDPVAWKPLRDAIGG